MKRAERVRKRVAPDDRTLAELVLKTDERVKTGEPGTRIRDEMTQ